MALHKLCAAIIAFVLSYPVAARTQETNNHWTVPAKPNPEKILDEAVEDASAGRYEDALAKHVWFHENALKIEPALYGVRLSFALMYWVELGKSYPPALAKLKSIRDTDGLQIKRGKGNRYLFHDFESINRVCEERMKTKDVFVWLDTNQPAFAKKVFDLAEPDLIKEQEFHLCGKYIDPASYENIVKSFHENEEIAKGSEAPKGLPDFDKEKFSNQAATLVALLVINGHREDAVKIATKAASELDDPQFKSLLEKAKNGEVPPPWP